MELDRGHWKRWFFQGRLTKLEVHTTECKDNKKISSEDTITMDHLNGIGSVLAKRHQVIHKKVNY